MIVVIDGPNKSGKSLLIDNVVQQAEVQNLNIKVRHWGPLKTDDREYTESLIEDNEYRGVAIWDRSWVCEYVYGTILNRKRRLVDNPWLGEFLHTRGVKLNGECFIVAPALAGLNIDLLDKTDAKYSNNPYLERSLFIEYADRFNWHKLFNSFNKKSLDGMTDIIMQKIHEHSTNKYQPKVAFVLEKTDDENIVGGWLPGSTIEVTKYAQEFHYGTTISDWIYADDISNYDITKYDIIVATNLKLRNVLQKINKIKEKIEFIPIAGILNNIESYDEHSKILSSMNIVNTALMRAWNATEHILYF